MNIEECNMIGRYKKLKKLGEGSYGVVYKALDPTNDKTVAIKELKLEGHEEGIPACHLREVGILKTLNHPNIIRLLDKVYIPENSSLFLVFECVDQPLSKFLEEKKQSKISHYLCKVACIQIRV